MEIALNREDWDGAPGEPGSDRDRNQYVEEIRADEMTKDWMVLSNGT